MVFVVWRGRSDAGAGEGFAFAFFCRPDCESTVWLTIQDQPIESTSARAPAA